MVIVFANSSGQYDFIVQTSIAFAFAKLNFSASVPDTRVASFSSTLDMSNETGIALVGHGSPGSIEGWSAAAVGAALADKVRGVSNKLRKLIVTSCYAGVRPGGKPGSSTVEVIASKLRGRGVGGLEIVGYNGPSIKNAELGFFATVVNDPTPGAAVRSAELSSAFALSANALATTTGDLKHLTVSDTANIGTLGVQAAQVSAPFYSQFIQDLDTAKLSLKGDDVARVAVVLD